MERVNELATNLAAYFKIEMTDANRRKLANICGVYDRAVLATVKNVLSHSLAKSITLGKIKRNNLDDIAFEVCNRYNITIHELKAKSDISYYIDGKRRYQLYIDARQAFSFAAQEFGYSSPQIGKFLQVDHTTVVHYWNGRKSPGF